jgi:polar amino acid transport system substrate-binding protein
MRTRVHAALALVILLATSAAAGCGDEDRAAPSASPTDGDAPLQLVQNGALTVASDIPFPPFTQGDPPDYDGFDVEVARAIGDRLGLETRFVDTPFDILLQGGRGRFDIAMAAISITDKREQSVDFSNPYLFTKQSLLVRADGTVRRVEDLGPDTFIGVEDGTVSEDFVEEETDAKVRAFPEADDANNALATGQVDAVVNDLSATQPAAEENPKLEVVASFETGDRYGILLPDGSEPLLERVNEALAAIKRDGTFAAIHRKWFKEDPSERLLTATHRAS